MPGDYSRETFKREKHYSGVLKQQGRVELDADDNEQVAIQHYRDETVAIDVIGQSGVPKKNDGFKIAVAAGGQDLTIAAGRYYVEGLLCELDNNSTYTAQPYFPNPDSTSPGSPPASPALRRVTLANGTYLAFLDAWTREITALDDEEIREVALGGPDTTTRLQNVWQVRLLRVGKTSPPASPPTSPPATIKCDSNLPEFEHLSAAPSGKLRARTQPPKQEDSACLLPPGTGFNRLENQLYRVEVHSTGPLNQATFKWSRDNASVETTITNIAGTVVTVSDLGKDEILNFAPGQWVEIVDEESTLKAAPHPLFQIDKIGPGPNEITLATAADLFAGGKARKLRRWDQTVSAGFNGVKADLAVWIDLENGIQVGFGSGDYRSGDYWLIPARTATGQIEWPTNPNGTPKPQSPNGIKHHYSRLALVQSSGGKLSFVADCRKPFPTLTEICATDICFDNKTCNFQDARTVQQALDLLCSRHEAGQCTFVVSPGQNLQAVFDTIGAKGNAEICFQAGRYVLPKTITVAGKGHLKISGIGFGTRLEAPDSEAAIRFEDCESILVRDIFAESGVARAGKNTPAEGLNGTLTFLNCKIVNVESTGLKCAAAPARAATCLTVRNAAGSVSAARVQHCILEPGHQQNGVLLVNVSRALVQDNIIRANLATVLSPAQLLADRQHRASLQNFLISEGRLGAVRGKRDKSNVVLTSGNQVVQFLTDTSLRTAWPALLQANPGTNINSPRALLLHAKRLATRLLVDQAFRNQAVPFRNFLNTLLAAPTVVGYQGVTVGGAEAAELRIINNTIAGFMQGIHVGLSKQRDRTHIAARNVTVSGNTISIILPAFAAKKERHGIFVGSCDSLMIDNNNIRLARQAGADQLEIDGIRVWGEIGNRALISQNHLDSATGDRNQSFNIGILFLPLTAVNANKLWRVNHNVAPSRISTVAVAAGVVSELNKP